MTRKRTVHEAAFRLSYDMKTQIAPMLAGMKVSLAPQQLRTMRLIWSIDRCTSADIVDTLKRDKAQVSRIVDELVKAGMITKETDPLDRRSRLLRLTAAGKKFFKRIESIESEFSEQLISGIKKTDLDTFFSVSDKLSENLKKMDAPK